MTAESIAIIFRLFFYIRRFRLSEKIQKKSKKLLTNDFLCDIMKLPLMEVYFFALFCAVYTDFVPCGITQIFLRMETFTEGGSGLDISPKYETLL